MLGHRKTVFRGKIMSAKSFVAALAFSIAACGNAFACDKVVGKDEQSWLAYWDTLYPNEREAGAMYYRTIVSGMLQMTGSVLQGNTINGYAVEDKIEIRQDDLCITR
jgi:hypothetical protein